VARRPTAAQLREKRARTMAIIGSVLLLIVMVVQGPKLMKALKGGSAQSGGTIAGALPAGVNPTAAKAATSSSSAAAVAVADGHLAVLSRFAFKDPFHALVNVPLGSTGATPGAATAGSKQAGSSTAAKTSPAAAAAAAIAPTVTFTATKTPPKPPNAALVKTNGKRQLIFVGDSFPLKNPLFKLVALTKKNIRIGVLGGSFTSGLPTIKLAKGKRLTLANKADGSRYVLQLLKLTNATPPPAAPAPSSTTPTDTTASTTTTTTTTTPATTTTTPSG
jgi:hypothetical protein